MLVSRFAECSSPEVLIYFSLRGGAGNFRQEKIAARPRKNRGTFSKKVPHRNQFGFFNRDRGRRDLFCTSLCVFRCRDDRCLRASDRGHDRDHGPSDGRARHAHADLPSSHRSSGPLHSVERPTPRQRTADASSNLGASDNGPPSDTSSLRSIRTRYRPDPGMVGAQLPLA